MKYNAFKVCEEVATRVDGAVAPGGFLKAFVSTDISELFFWDKEYLTNYIANSTKKTITLVPGYHYYKKIDTFLGSHFIKGEKYLEFLKCDSCHYCAENKPLQILPGRIPEPMPDITSESFKYLHVNQTPTRSVQNDYNPRVQLKDRFEKKEISLENVEQIEEFSKKFIVNSNLVVSALEELHAKKHWKNVRGKDRKEKNASEKEKTYNEYDWEDLIRTNNLKHCNVSTLNKYLIHNKLNQFMKLKKPQKIEAIKSSFYRKNGGQSMNAEREIFHEEAMDTGSESEKDDSDDEVICVIGSDSDEITCSDIENGPSADGNIEEEDMEDCADEDTNLFTRTRTGRVAGSWCLSSYIGESNTVLFYIFKIQFDFSFFDKSQQL